MHKIVGFFKELVLAIVDTLFGFDSHSANRYRGR